MNLALNVVGIPIALPTWTQVVAYIFLVLFAAAIGVSVWRGVLKSRQNTVLGEIRAKTNLMFLIVRGWQDRYEEETGSSPAAVNEHYAPDNLASSVSGSTRADINETTDVHERVSG